MKRWALMSGEEVLQVVEQAAKPSIPGSWRDCTGRPVGPGQMWDGSPARPQVPQSVTMRQARLALHSISRLSAVDTAINSLPEPDRTKARIEWDYSNELQRSNPFVTLLGQAIGLTPGEIDDLFIKAAAIT